MGSKRGETYAKWERINAMWRKRGKNIIFRRGGGINIIFRLKYRHLYRRTETGLLSGEILNIC